MDAKLIELIQCYAELDTDNLNPQSNIFCDLGMSSFDLMALMSEVEEEYGIQININDVMRLQTIEQVNSYIQKAKTGIK